MNLYELKKLHDQMKRKIDQWENSNRDDGNVEFEPYMVYEYGVLELYEKIIEGICTRKDLLIFSIRDMYCFMKRNNFTCNSDYMAKFDKKYGFEE